MAGTEAGDLHAPGGDGGEELHARRTLSAMSFSNGMPSALRPDSPSALIAWARTSASLSLSSGSSAARAFSRKAGSAAGVLDGTRQHGGTAAGDDAETPDAVKAGEAVFGLRRGFGEHVEAFRAAGERELRADADPHVRVKQQGGQIVGAALLESLLDQGGDLRGFRRAIGFVRSDGIHAPGVMGFPAADEVGDGEFSIPRVFHIGGGRAPVELMGVGHFHARAGWLDLEGPDAGFRRAAAVVADEETAGLGFEKTGSGVIGEAGGAGGEVGHRREDVGGLFGIRHFPDALGHPSGGRFVFHADLFVEREQSLMAHVPSGIRAIDDVNDARLVALVAVVIHRDEVSELVERDFLRVAQAAVDDFEVRAIGIEAENKTFVVQVVMTAFAGGGVEPAVAHGSVNPAVGTEDEAVEVVAGERDVDAESVLDDVADIGLAVAVRIAQRVDLRNAGEENRAFIFEDSGCDAIQHIVESSGEDILFPEHAVRIRIG